MAAIRGISYKALLILLIPLVGATIPPISLWDPRIINGTEAKPEETRHQVSVRMKSREIIFGTGHICGGSLISPKIVLSAAHCFYNDDVMDFNSARGYFVVMGTLNRFEKTNDTLVFDLSHIVYPDFDRPTFNNDLALLFLNGTVPDNNPAVAAIEMIKTLIPAGIMCQVTGWGQMETGYTADTLQTVDVPIIDRETCSTNFGKDAITDGMLCAGYMEGGKDACQGDSGGPLVNNGQLVGVVSFGEGCALPGFPGVYTDVRYHRAWIEKNMKAGAGSKSITLLGLAMTLIIIYMNSY